MLFVQSLKSAHGAESAARKAKREKEEESNRICKELEDLKQSHERQKGDLKSRDKEIAALISAKEELHKQLQTSAQEKEAAQEKIKALEVSKNCVFKPGGTLISFLFFAQ